MALVNRIQPRRDRDDGVTDTFIGPELGNGPSANGLVEIACGCPPGGHRARRCGRVVAPLEGQPPRAQGRPWGPPPGR